MQTVSWVSIILARLFCLSHFSLSAAAASSLVDITEQSSTGLQYMVDNKSVLDLKINVQPTYVIVPENGVHDG